ncbi:MAG TPA: hypothetical protein VFC47_11245 [Caulobacteraceae bacterium]|nr:hypothetical protein [Caulobacteraceae bacterium]
MTAIDLNPIVDQVILPILAPIALGLICWAARRVAGLCHVQISAANGALLDKAIGNGVALAASDIDGSIPLVPGPAMVASAAAYVNTTAPATLKALGVSPAALGAAIAARIAADPPSPVVLANPQP